MYVLLHSVIDQAERAPKRVVFPEGEHDKILRAAKILVDRGIAHPVLLARHDRIAAKLDELGLDTSRVTVIHAKESPQFDDYANRLFKRRRRHGVTLEDARHLMRSRNYFGSMMVEEGDADGLISGLTQYYAETIRPALQVIGTRPDVQRVAGAYILIFKERLFFLADTTVNIDPTPAVLAETALLTADLARRFGFEPRVAMLSFSNFGSNLHESAQRVREAVSLASAMAPDLVIDGEMQADTAVFESILDDAYSWCRLDGPANILIFPDLNSANIAYKLLWRLANAEAIGPILLGMDKPVHVLQRGVEVADIVNMAAICVVDAQERERTRYTAGDTD